MKRLVGQRLVGAATAVGLALSLTACGDPAHELEVGTVGYVNGFAGGVAASEPRAVLVGRQTLSAGGTAADAAAVMILTMTATFPSAVGLGGGGVCLIHDHETATTETLDFLPPASSGPVAVPALPRGVYALQAKYGRLRWAQVVAPAEGLARFGERISQALANDMAATGLGRLTADPTTARVFVPSGRLPVQGDTLVQVDLAGTLGRLRERGVGILYAGNLGREWLEAVRVQGSRLTSDDLRTWQPRFIQTARVDSGNEVVHVPPVDLAGGGLAALWAGGTPPATPATTGPGGASVIAVDREGSAVVCGLTMNGAFGTGRMAGGLGMLTAPPASAAGQSAIPLGVALRINHNVNEFRFGGVAAGAGALPVLERVTKAATVDDAPLTQAVAAMAGQPPGPALMTALGCNQGLPSHPGSCAVVSDPRGAGYGTLVGQE